MPRENKTKYAVLGLLAYAPLSGYDIRRIYAQSLGNFWSESYGHIYPILRRLEEEGLASRDVQHQMGRPDRHLYTITERGREELHRWLSQPAEPRKERIELLLKVFHGWEMGAGRGDRAGARLSRRTRGAACAYAHYEEDMTRQRGAAGRLLALDVSCGQHVSEAYIAWCDETIAKLEELPAEPRAGAPRPAARLDEPPGGKAMSRQRHAPCCSTADATTSHPGAVHQALVGGLSPAAGTVDDWRLRDEPTSPGVPAASAAGRRRRACASTRTPGARSPRAWRAPTCSSTSRRSPSAATHRELKKALDHAIPRSCSLPAQERRETRHPHRYERVPDLLVVGTVPAGRARGTKRRLPPSGGAQHPQPTPPPLGGRRA